MKIYVTNTSWSVSVYRTNIILTNALWGRLLLPVSDVQPADGIVNGCVFIKTFSILYDSVLAYFSRWQNDLLFFNNLPLQRTKHRNNLGRHSGVLSCSICPLMRLQVRHGSPSLFSSPISSFTYHRTCTPLKTTLLCVIGEAMQWIRENWTTVTLTDTFGVCVFDKRASILFISTHHHHLPYAMLS